MREIIIAAGGLVVLVLTCLIFIALDYIKTKVGVNNEEFMLYLMLSFMIAIGFTGLLCCKINE